MRPSLDIVIVNWNAGEQLVDCLASIAATSTDGLELRRVVVVDNASTDGSADNLDRFGLPLVLIRNTANLGFGRASNLGARDSSADFLLFLNPDTRLFADSLLAPVRFMADSAHAAVGICGIKLVDAENQIHRHCARFITVQTVVARAIGLASLGLWHSHVMSEWDHANSRPVDHVIGAFYLIRRTLFEKLRGFDERFFVYLEDIDLSYRARQAGHRCHYLAETAAYHKAGGTSEKVKATRLFYALMSQVRYAQKHFSLAGAGFAVFVTLIVEPLVRAARAIARGSFEELSQTALAYRQLYAALLSGQTTSKKIV